MLLKGATHNLTVRTRSEIALYLLNHKRAHLRTLEERFRIAIMVNADATIGGQLSFVIEKGEQVHSLEQARALALQPATAVPIEEEEEEEEEEYEGEDESPSEEAAVSGSDETAHAADEAGSGRTRRRRRRGRRGGEARPQQENQGLPQEAADFHVPRRHQLADRRAVKLTAALTASSFEDTPPHELTDALHALVGIDFVAAETTA